MLSFLQLKRSKFLTNMISKLKSKLASIALSLTLSPIAAAKAQGGVTPVAPPSTIDIPSLVTRIMNWAFGLLIVLAAAFIFYAAYLYLTAQSTGKAEEKITQAKNFILYAVIAIIVGFVARGLVSIVIGLLQ